MTRNASEKWALLIRLTDAMPLPEPMQPYYRRLGPKTNFSEIWIKIQKISLNKTYLRKWRQLSWIKDGGDLNMAGLSRQKVMIYDTTGKQSKL